MTTTALTFRKTKETKGAVQYTEVDTQGLPKPQGEATIGTLYLRKSALGGQIPDYVTASVTWGTRPAA